MNMQKLITFATTSTFDTFRAEKKLGKDWIVVKGVPLVEGVLKNYLVPMEEFGAFIQDWNGVPLVIRHPTANGGVAKTPDVDVPVVGYFYKASLDEKNRRLVGEFWLDKAALDATEDGKAIMNTITKRKMMEVSTGYHAAIENKVGFHKEKKYLGIHRGLHPDHIAILPDQTGACSNRDGCGINRNAEGESCQCKEKKMEWNAISQDTVMHLKGDEQSLTDQLTAIRDAFNKMKYPAATPSQPEMNGWIREVFNDRVIIEEGDELFSASYSKDEAGMVTFDKKADWVKVMMEKKYVPVKTNANAPAPVQNMMPEGVPDKMKALYEKVFKSAKGAGDKDEVAAKKAWAACKSAGWTKGKDDKWMMKKNDTGDTDNQESDHAVSGVRKLITKGVKSMNKNNVITTLLAAFGYTAVFNEDENSDVSEAILTSKPPTLEAPAEVVSLNSILNELGGADDLKVFLNDLKGLREAMGEGGLTALVSTIREADLLVKNVQAREKAEKDNIVLGLTQNAGKDFPYSQEELEAKPIEELRKLNLLAGRSTQRVDYSLLGNSVTIRNKSDEEFIAPPSVFFAKQNGKEE